MQNGNIEERPIEIRMTGGNKFHVNANCFGSVDNLVWGDTIEILTLSPSGAVTTGLVLHNGAPVKAAIDLISSGYLNNMILYDYLRFSSRGNSLQLYDFTMRGREKIPVLFSNTNQQFNTGIRSREFYLSKFGFIETY